MSSKNFHLAFIALGSNLEDPQLQCQRALDQIKNLPQTELLVCSSFYQTKPLVPKGADKEGIPFYVNAVCKIATELSPQELLAQLRKIEEKMGRKRKKKWESRLIDLDLLFYDSLVMKTKNLIIPHPEIEKRSFVLIPLTEINPNWEHPVLKKTIRILAEELERQNS